MEVSFEDSVVKSLERIATALEESTAIQREDLDFRRTQLEAAAAEQRALVEQLQAGITPGAPAAQSEHARRVRRGG